MFLGSFISLEKLWSNVSLDAIQTSGWRLSLAELGVPNQQVPNSSIIKRRKSRRLFRRARNSASLRPVGRAFLEAVRGRNERKSKSFTKAEGNASSLT